MGRKRRPHRLSPGELEIMSMLWEQGPLTLSEAHQRFGNYGRPVGYPTMQTRLNRLVDKGLVGRSKQRPASYKAAVSADLVGIGHLDQLLDRVGRDRLIPLVAHLISERSLTAEEIGELKRLLAEVEKTGK